MLALLPDAPCYILAAIPLPIFAAYTVFGATGFGSSLVSIPVLRHAQMLVSAALLVPAMLFGYFVGNRVHHALSRRRVLNLIAGLLAANGVLLVLPALALLRGE